jgi:arginine/lysine/histidine transport system permease protein
MDFKLDFIFQNSYYFIMGLKFTLILSVCGTVLGLMIGTILAMGKTSKMMPLRFLASAYIELVRGTPLLIQLFIVYYSIQQVEPLVAGIVALAVNSGAYVAEIIRAGIGSVEHGQYEAARSLGLSDRLAFWEIVFPQAIKNIIPALGNELVVLVKETSVISVIGVSELIRTSDIIISTKFRIFEPLVAITAIYFVLTFTISRLVGMFERRLKESDR